MELRYSGRPAAVLRLIRAVYFGALVNTFVLAWQLYSLYSISAVFLDLNPADKSSVLCWSVPLCLTLIMLCYSSLAGLYGVVATDMVQFGVAMVSCCVLAGSTLSAAGGLGNIVSTVGESRLAFVPSVSDPSVPWVMFASLFLVQWYACQAG